LFTHSEEHICQQKQALEMVKKLPESATWDDILYEMFVRRKIETGIRAADEGNMVPHELAKSASSRNDLH